MSARSVPVRNPSSRVARSLETRLQILKATSKLIRKRGIARATTKEIAREANCAEGTLYKHFDSKEELFLAALVDSIPRYSPAVEPANANQFTLPQNLTRVVLSVLSFFEQAMPHLISLSADADLLERHRRRLEKKKNALRLMFKAVAAYIKAEQALGRINPELEPVGAAALLLGPCCHWALTRIVNGVPPLQTTDREWAALLVESVLIPWSSRSSSRALHAQVAPSE